MGTAAPAAGRPAGPAVAVGRLVLAPGAWCEGRPVAEPPRSGRDQGWGWRWRQGEATIALGPCPWPSPSRRRAPGGSRLEPSGAEWRGLASRGHRGRPRARSRRPEPHPRAGVRREGRGRLPTRLPSALHRGAVRWSGVPRRKGGSRGARQDGGRRRGPSQGSGWDRSSGGAPQPCSRNGPPGDLFRRPRPQSGRTRHRRWRLWQGERRSRRWPASGWHPVHAD